MKIKLISHASVVIETADTRLWTDPWLSGRAFNDSWALMPEAAWDPAELETIDYIWLSHEHPDHFHLATLKALPDAFKKRVTILFMENNSDKMFRALEKLGYPNHRKLPHRAIVQLTPATRVYCYQEGQINSCLAVLSGGESVLDINDAEIRTADCRLIRKDIGACDVVLNQFSIAGYSGLLDYEKHLPALANRILDNVSANHADMGAKATIPFASFVYFCAADNWYVNRFANTPRKVFDRLAAEGKKTVVLYPGDSYALGTPHDPEPALRKFDGAWSDLEKRERVAPPPVPIEKIQEAFEGLSDHLRERFPKQILAVLRPVSVQIPDLGTQVTFDIRRRGWAVAPGSVEDSDLVINSQPLFFAMKFPFGVQTLGVSARYALRRRPRNWQLHRVLFALNNAELYLKPEYLLTRRNLSYLRGRLRGSGTQLVRRLQTMLD